MSAANLFPQTNQKYRDVSPDGKQILSYPAEQLNFKKVTETDSIPFGTQPEWQAVIERQIGGLAWADYDQDGDLDLAVGCYHSNSYPPINEFETEIYRNDNGVLTTLPAWTSTDMKSTTDIKWADINNDGYPDLLAANGDESLVPSVIYMNSESGLDSIPSWSSSDFNWTVGAAFGDINGDGLLDLVFGNQGNSAVPTRPICVFYNTGGSFYTNPDFLTSDEMITNSVALADADNSDLTEKTETFTANGNGSAFMLSMIPVYKVDSVAVNGIPVNNFTMDNISGWISLGSVPAGGDQVIVKYRYIKKGDLAAAKWVNYSSGVYFNTGSYLNGLPGWTVGNTIAQKGIAWADMDGDGYLDLAVGGSGSPAVVYKNNEGTLSSSPVWTSAGSNTSTQDLAWGDINNDGYPELAVVHFGYSRAEIFMNNAGMLETTPSWTYTTGSPATALAFGDLNGDGFLDLAIGTARAPIAVFLNMSVVPVELKSFTAESTADGVRLMWTTATETNNKGFVVERSQKSGVISQNWTQVGFVQGYGTSSEIHNYNFTDKNLEAGSYSFRLKQIDFDGSYKYSNTAEVEVNTPLQFGLEQNYPNPFNPTTRIQYAVSSKQFVTLKVYDILGNEIKTLVSEEKPAGKYNVKLTMNNEQLSSGVYLYRLQAGGYTAVKKMVYMK
jgi:hypothetical protein